MACENPNCCKNQNGSNSTEMECVCEGNKANCQCALRTREEIRQKRLEKMAQDTTN